MLQAGNGESVSLITYMGHPTDEGVGPQTARQGRLPVFLPHSLGFGIEEKESGQAYTVQA